MVLKGGQKIVMCTMESRFWPDSWYPRPCRIPSSWVWARLHDVLLSHRICRMWCDVTAKSVTSIFFILPLWPSCLLILMKLAAIWRDQRVKELREADSQWGAWLSVQNPLRNWVMLTTTWMTLEIRCFPSHALRWDHRHCSYVAFKRLWSRRHS